LHARQVSGHHDVALPGLKRLECGRAGREQAVGDVEALLLIEPLLECYPDRIVVDRRLSEQRHLERRLLRPRGQRRKAEADCDHGRQRRSKVGHLALLVGDQVTET